MNHNLFKAQTFEQGKEEVVGACNGFSMDERWRTETPLFAKAILSRLPKQHEGTLCVLDYGCGVGRLAKECLSQKETLWLTGLDASADMLKQAKEYVNDPRFDTILPYEITHQYDLIYCVYVLQHAPAIEIREILARIYNHLKDDGVFVYCSSDYRMAIRFDGQGFFDDRFLGVNLREEISRFFQEVEPLFTQEELSANQVLGKMIAGNDGGLAHPAFVYKKRAIKGELYNARQEESKESKESKEVKTVNNSNGKPQGLLLANRLAPGDILVMTSAIRELHRNYPGKYEVDVRTPCNELFENNPHITKHNFSETDFNLLNGKFSSVPLSDMSVASHTGRLGDILVIDMHYPLIHRSGKCGAHFSQGHTEWLEEVLGVKIQQDSIRPEFYLSQNERDWPSPVVVKNGYTGRYWVINAGSKSDYTLKQYPYYQEVVDLLKDKVRFVQIGQKEHNHKPLSGVIDLVGQTSIRELARIIYHSEGVLTCVSLPMHLTAAIGKPCVVVAGARESMRWECYPSHQFLYVNGCLPCALADGCWKSKISDCHNKKDNVPLCMALIHPEDVVRSIERYYEGGMLELTPILELVNA
jgi:ADP-heptose:LPS heptosyltransferase/SAM-dependent methyltransferase